ncbi:hypothetical protein Fmac_008447 [Flemingia macrophylla]|uniref:Uncharacterized protein n=1 Tax=Flemingia macrophylla TaxID=520843 RepID=A0ABD1MXE6_9FABA
MTLSNDEDENLTQFLESEEANANTVPFVARVTELYAYYSALFESLKATPLLKLEQFKLLDKWRACMSMVDSS